MNAEQPGMGGAVGGSGGREAAAGEVKAGDGGRCRDRDALLAKVVHDLRAPLNAIAGWTHVLLGSEPPVEERRKAFEAIDRNAKAQARLLDDLMEALSLLQGRVTLDLRPSDPVGVAQAAVADAQGAAAAKGVGLSWTPPDTSAPITADAKRLQQVVAILLGNAIKFTPAGGDVRLALSSCDGAVRFSVTDSGRGLEPGALASLRRDEAGNAPQPQSLSAAPGVGLTTALALVGLHGGTLTCESKGRRQGATFLVEIPQGFAGTEDPG